MAGGKVHAVIAPNPTLPWDAFFDAFSKEGGFGTASRSPLWPRLNFQGLSLEQLLCRAPAEGAPLDQNPLAHLVTKRWVYDQYQSWWHGDEGSSPCTYALMLRVA